MLQTINKAEESAQFIEDNREKVLEIFKEFE